MYPSFVITDVSKYFPLPIIKMFLNDSFFELSIGFNSDCLSIVPFEIIPLSLYPQAYANPSLVCMNIATSDALTYFISNLLPSVSTGTAISVGVLVYRLPWSSAASISPNGKVSGLDQPHPYIFLSPVIAIVSYTGHSY